MQESADKKTKFKKQKLSHGRDGFKVNKIGGKLGSGDQLTWEAPPETSITISFPATRDPFAIGSLTLEPGESIVRNVERAKKFMSGPTEHFQYTAYCEATKNYAEWNSEPEVIIDE